MESPAIENNKSSRRQNQNIIQSLVEARQIGARTGRSVLSFWSNKLTELDEQQEPDYFESALLHNCIMNAFWGIYLIEISSRSMVFKFSPHSDPLLVKILDSVKYTPEPEPDDTAKISETGGPTGKAEPFSLFTQQLFYNQKNYVLAIVSLKPEPDANALDRIKNMFTNYFFMQEPPHNAHVVNFFKLTSADILHEVHQYSSNKHVTFIYIQFEPLKKYVKYGGDYFAHEVVDHIKNKLYETLSTDIICYALTLRKYLIVCPNADDVTLEKKLKNMTFYFKQILLTYQVNFFTAKPPIENLGDIWKKLVEK